LMKRLLTVLAIAITVLGAFDVMHA